MMCNPCLAQLHELCEDLTPVDGEDYVQCCCWSGGNGANSVQDERGRISLGDALLEGLQGRTRSPKDPEHMLDPLSTGRKRAAEAKPLIEGSVCEWAGLKYAGGGVEPIIGCSGNILTQVRGQYARHHGPDKSVLNNSPENLHLVCPKCHNRWHTLNDKYYGDGTGDSRPANGATWLPDGPYKLHDGETKATGAEILNNEISWNYSKKDRENVRATTE